MNDDARLRTHILEEQTRRMRFGVEGRLSEDRRLALVQLRLDVGGAPSLFYLTPAQARSLAPLLVEEAAIAEKLKAEDP